MSTDLKLASPAPDVEAPSPTITAADRLAARVEALLGRIEAIVPGLETPHPAKSGDARAARTVSRPFIQSMIAGVEDHPDWEELGFFDPAEAQAALQFDDAFKPVARRLIMLAAKINFTIASRKAKVAIGAMNTYMMARRFARRRVNAAMSLRVEMLRRELGRKNGRSTAPDVPPVTLT
ncbi:MAG TPA: hypothetical protein VJZ76_02375 [Thermoanaerobaculia bacterium]|nr:hypothetical protein [Thermoanaerobaculia bacterium]